MAAFSYRALDVSGKVVKGTLEGDSERQIRSQLRAQKTMLGPERGKRSPADNATPAFRHENRHGFIALLVPRLPFGLAPRRRPP